MQYRPTYFAIDDILSHLVAPRHEHFFFRIYTPFWARRTPRSQQWPREKSKDNVGRESRGQALGRRISRVFDNILSPTLSYGFECRVPELHFLFCNIIRQNIQYNRQCSVAFGSPWSTALCLPNIRTVVGSENASQRRRAVG